MVLLESNLVSEYQILWISDPLSCLRPSQIMSQPTHPPTLLAQVSYSDFAAVEADAYFSFLYVQDQYGNKQCIQNLNLSEILFG